MRVMNVSGQSVKCVACVRRATTTAATRAAELCHQAHEFLQ